MTLLYGVNMYFQSFGAVAIVKVNSAWFHVRERGSFSGIFGTMISSGIFFAFTVNKWVLDAVTERVDPSLKTLATRWVFFLPAAVLLIMAVVESFLLRDRPGEAGQKDFDTGEGVDDGEDVSLFDVAKRVLSHPVILTIAFIEFCTGTLRSGIMHWYPIYVNEVTALPSASYLNNGSWGDAPLTIALRLAAFFGIATVFFVLAKRSTGGRKAVLYASGGLVFLAPFLQGGWGGMQMVAGVIGGNLAGYVSDLFFQSRRAPAAGGLYAVLLVCVIAMPFALGGATTTLAKGAGILQDGDKVLAVAGTPVTDWASARRAFACVPAPCKGEARFDADSCLCSAHPKREPATALTTGTIPLEIERGGAKMTVDAPDTAVKVAAGKLEPTMRAGDGRTLKGEPVPVQSPYILGVVVFVMMLSVIGTHGLLSGTATMDFAGKKGTGMAVGIIDGFVYLGTAVESFALGYLTTKSWTYWPLFLVPFGVVGLVLCRRIWDARAGKAH
jgi:sugar phosphate permease